MPDMTMRQAAEWAGVTRGTIHKAITSGRISANKSDTGVYQINPAELERVYPRRQPVGVSGDTPESHRDTPELTALRREVELLREVYRASEAREADLRSERDRLLGIVEGATRLLTYQQNAIVLQGQGSNNSKSSISYIYRYCVKSIVSKTRRIKRIENEKF